MRMERFMSTKCVSLDRPRTYAIPSAVLSRCGRSVADVVRSKHGPGGSVRRAGWPLATMHREHVDGIGQRRRYTQGGHVTDKNQSLILHALVVRFSRG